ncbi:ABC transporter ATP-binding protein [Paenibacillus sanguinis]|uniref:ABC transporter ATP-binding protein n=1 Tax=Paenibacillus sanguinis TaxID=225906 RepID=UPI00036AA9AB|nr:ABC transporter ATP-binding protein [Paenibacillus sanguinis]
MPDTTMKATRSEEALYAIEVSDVTFTYPGSGQPVLDHASLTIEHGTFTAIIGGNGSGKSTLCKLFNGLIPHYYSGDFEGEVRVQGLSTLQKNVAVLSKHVGYVYQDFDNQLVRPTVLDEACFAPLNYGLGDYRERALRALELCGLSDLQHRYIWELSGGQKHLLALAGVLSLEPEILIVDEPVSQLDPSHARQVYEVLRQLHQVHGKTIIVIEHHTEFIADFCQEVCLLEHGRVLWKRPVAAALGSLADLERLGIQPPEVTQAAALLATQSWTRLPITTEEAIGYFADLMQPSQGLPEQLQQQGRPILIPTAREQARADNNPNTVIQFTGASLKYRTIRKAEQNVLHDIHLHIHEGERIALVGNNGAGKSSLMKLIAGIAKPSKGVVTVLEQETGKVSMEQLSRDVAFVFQNPEDMFIEDSVHKEISYCLKRRGYSEADEILQRMLQSFRLEDLQQRDARLLSGGQQRRVSLAIGAAIRPAIMLLDEPTANLDMATREELLSTLEELGHHVRTVMIATHDMQLVHRWATRVIVMHQGRILADGTAEEVFASPHLVQQAGLALTQSMQLSLALGLRPACGSPAELAQQLSYKLAGKESHSDGACAQLV